jgi:hypothetical protein
MGNISIGVVGDGNKEIDVKVAPAIPESSGRRNLRAV